MALAAIAAEARRHQVFWDRQAAARLGQDVIQALGVLAAITAAMLPGAQDLLAESVSGGAGVNELCFIDSCLHQQPTAAPMLRGPSVTGCNHALAQLRATRDPLPRPATAFPFSNPTSTMRSTIASTALCLALTGGFWYALTSSLTDMTRADCQAGVHRACNQLKADGVQP